MRGSPVKLGIIVATVVIGIVTLAAVFNTGTSSAPPSSLTSPTPSPHARSPKPPKPSPNSQGVQVGVYNGTTSPGQAAKVGGILERHGYVIVQVGNTTDSPQKTTTVMYLKPNDQAAADQLAATQFNNAPVQQMPAGFQVVVNGQTVAPAKSAHLIVLIGNDYTGK